MSDLLNSVKKSLKRNGYWLTQNIVIQYLGYKLSKEASYSFSYSPFHQKIQLRPGSSDFSVFRQIAMNGEYDIDYPFRPRVIVDAGANIGLASLYFNSRFPEAEIYAIEPDNNNFNQIRQNTGSISQIHPYKMALWNKKEQLNFVVQNVDAWSIQVTSDGGKTHEVEGIDVSSFMALNNLSQIDILKIDIEGAETEVFGDNYQSWLPKVKMIIIEMHEHLRPGCTDIIYNALKLIPHSVSVSGENLVINNLDANLK